MHIKFIALRTEDSFRSTCKGRLQLIVVTMHQAITCINKKKSEKWLPIHFASELFRNWWHSSWLCTCRYYPSNERASFSKMFLLFWASSQTRGFKLRFNSPKWFPRFHPSSMVMGSLLSLMTFLKLATVPVCYCASAAKVICYAPLERGRHVR